MVKIRMRRMGSKKKPFYRIVVADSRRQTRGRFIEEIGYYNPVSNPKQFKVNAQRAKEWINNGAQPSTTVKKLFDLYNVLDENAGEFVESNAIKVNDEKVNNEVAEEENVEEVTEEVETEEIEEEKEEVEA